MSDVLEQYYGRILKPALYEFGASESYIEYTVQIIDKQMKSLLMHWNNINFRKTVLLLGREEGE